MSWLTPWKITFFRTWVMGTCDALFDDFFWKCPFSSFVSLDNLSSSKPVRPHLLQLGWTGASLARDWWNSAVAPNISIWVGYDKCSLVLEMDRTRDRRKYVDRMWYSVETVWSVAPGQSYRDTDRWEKDERQSLTRPRTGWWWSYLNSASAHIWNRSWNAVHWK